MEEHKIAVFPLPQNQLVDVALKQLPSEGILSQSNTGYVYVKVADDFIHRLFPLIEIPTKRLPDYFSNFEGNIGAHISVMYKGEKKENLPVAQLGKRVTFQKMRVCKASLNAKNYVVLLVKALELEQLRTQQGLGKKPIYQGLEVDFHITIAVY